MKKIATTIAMSIARKRERLPADQQRQERLGHLVEAHGLLLGRPVEAAFDKAGRKIPDHGRRRHERADPGRDADERRRGGRRQDGNDKLRGSSSTVQQGPLVDEGHATVERMAEACTRIFFATRGAVLATASIASDCSIAQAFMPPHTQAAPARVTVHRRWCPVAARATDALPLTPP